MKNYYLKFTLLLFIISCKEKPEYADMPDTHTYHYLTQEQLSKTPYFTNPAFDTLTFLSNTNDTLIFVKLKTDTFYHKTSRSDCPDCPVNYDYYQQLSNKYTTIKGNGKFEVRHILKDYTTSNAVLVNFNNFIFGYYDKHVGSITFRDYIGDLTINNVLYHEVLFAGDLGDTTLAICYINLTYGAFYFNIKNQSMTYLLKK
jgi:hypothetical protein